MGLLQVQGWVWEKDFVNSKITTVLLFLFFFYLRYRLKTFQGSFFFRATERLRVVQRRIKTHVTLFSSHPLTQMVDTISSSTIVTTVSNNVPIVNSTLILRRTEEFEQC